MRVFFFVKKLLREKNSRLLRLSVLDKKLLLKKSFLKKLKRINRYKIFQLYPNSFRNKALLTKSKSYKLLYRRGNELKYPFFISNWVKSSNNKIVKTSSSYSFSSELNSYLKNLRYKIGSNSLYSLNSNFLRRSLLFLGKKKFLALVGETNSILNLRNSKFFNYFYNSLKIKFASQGSSMLKYSFLSFKKVSKKLKFYKSKNRFSIFLKFNKLFLNSDLIEKNFGLIFAYNFFKDVKSDFLAFKKLGSGFFLKNNYSLFSSFRYSYISHKKKNKGFGFLLQPFFFLSSDINTYKVLRYNESFHNFLYFLDNFESQKQVENIKNYRKIEPLLVNSDKNLVLSSSGVLDKSFLVSFFNQSYFFKKVETKKMQELININSLVNSFAFSNIKSSSIILDKNINSSFYLQILEQQASLFKFFFDLRFYFLKNNFQTYFMKNCSYINSYFMRLDSNFIYLKKPQSRFSLLFSGNDNYKIYKLKKIYINYFNALSFYIGDALKTRVKIKSSSVNVLKKKMYGSFYSNLKKLRLFNFFLIDKKLVYNLEQSRFLSNTKSLFMFKRKFLNFNTFDLFPIFGGSNIFNYFLYSNVFTKFSVFENNKNYNSYFLDKHLNIFFNFLFFFFSNVKNLNYNQYLLNSFYSLFFSFVKLKISLIRKNLFFINFQYMKGLSNLLNFSNSVLVNRRKFFSDYLNYSFMFFFKYSFNGFFISNSNSLFLNYFEILRKYKFILNFLIEKKHSLSFFGISSLDSSFSYLNQRYLSRNIKVNFNNFFKSFFVS